jgi:hypothetical protein
MTNINLAELYHRVDPWELTIELDQGVKLPVRRLTNADIAEVHQILRAPGGMTDQSRLLLSKLFDDPQPDTSGWDDVKAGFALLAMTTYYEELIKKKSAEAREIARKAIATSTGSKS